MESSRREFRVSFEVKHLEPGILRNVGSVSSPVPHSRQSATNSARYRVHRKSRVFGNLHWGLTVKERHLQHLAVGVWQQ
jgi:hypothetical protein